MTFVDFLWAAGGASIAVGFWLFIRAQLQNDDDLHHLSNGAYAIGYWILLVASALDHERIGVAIDVFFAILNTYLWWKNRKNRKRRKASQSLGAKTRAIIEGMARKLTPSPIPTPTGG
jgi:hypothetical protein